VESCSFTTADAHAVLLGPIRAISYILAHGFEAAVLAQCITRKLPFGASITAVAAARAVCQLSTLVLSSVTIGQNILQLIVTNLGMLLDKAGLMLGTNASSLATTNFLYGVFVFSVAFNCALPPECLMRLG
jgi:hypothetical protein